MAGFRALVVLLLLAALLLLALSVLTGQLRYRRWGVVLLRWTVGAVLLFFAVLAAERLLLGG